MVHGINVNGYDYPPCPSGSVLYLPGLPGQGATIWDRSKSATHGTITGAIWRRSVGGLWYLHFDGDDKVNLGASNLLANENEYTIMSWFRTSDVTDVGAIYAEGSTATVTPLVMLCGSYDLLGGNKTILFHRDDAGNNCAIGYSVSNDTWYHVAGVRRAANSWELVVDGVSRATDNTNVGVTTINTRHLGAKETTTFGFYLIGDTPLPMTILSALSLADIRNHMNATKVLVRGY